MAQKGDNPRFKFSHILPPVSNDRMEQRAWSEKTFLLRMFYFNGDINRTKVRHSRESGNPGKDWIPGQSRNDKRDMTHVIVYIYAMRYALYPMRTFSR